MFKLGALAFGIVAGLVVAVVMATTSSAESPLLPRISTSCLSIEGVTHRLVQRHDTWVEASVAATNAPAEWINLTLVKRMRELPDTACR